MVWKLVKLLIGLGLLYALFHFGILDLGAIAKVIGRPWLLLAAVLLLFGTIVLQALRWHLLLIAQGIRPRFSATNQIVLSGAFFNTVLPGAFGGDLVRMGYIYRATDTHRISGLMSLLMDRLTGLAGLLTIGVAVNLLLPLDVTGLAGWTLYAIAAGFVAGIAVLLLFGHRIARFITQRLPRRMGAVAGIVDTISRALEAYLRRWPYLAAAWAISLLLYGLALLSLLITASILQIGSLSTSGYAIAGVWAILVNNLPLTPGGLGVGESAFAQLCLLLDPTAGGAAYATVFIVYRATIILSTLPGVLAYYTYRPEAFAVADGLPQSGTGTARVDRTVAP